MTDYTTKVAELQADVQTIWKLQCQNLYNSKNLGALAVRESVQNSLDAISKAIKAGQLKEEEAYISIDFKGDELVITDNGTGMDIQTIHEKFLNLGGTTKGDENSVGGFGIAKAVILGCGTGFKIETQDNLLTSEDLGKNPIQKTGFFHGTRITLYGVQTGKNSTISDNPNTFLAAVKDYILSSDISVSVYINGEKFDPYFTKTAKTRRSPGQFNISSDSIPDNTKLKINVFKNAEDTCKYLYVQLRGLTQFKQYLGWNANCDIVVDFQTKLDPRSTDYPFSTNREGLKAQYQGILESIRDKVSQSPLSIAADDEYKETLYDNVNGSIEQARAISTSVSAKETQEIMEELTKVVVAASVVKSSKSDGIIPQGGSTTPSVLDRVKQYNETLEDMAEQQGITKAEMIKQLSMDTVKKIDNPLEHSWLVWEDKNNTKRLNKGRTVDLIIVWDSILRIMAENYKELDGKVFYPGVVVKKDTLGLCVEKSVEGVGRTYIMMNPFEVNGENDTEIALYLMGLAAHELSHFVCGCYEAHGETFSYTREAIMNANLSQLTVITKLIKAGKLKKTLNKLTSKTSQTVKNECGIDFIKMSNAEVTQMAIDYGVDVEALQEKYTNEPILRMRMIMAIKKAYMAE